MSSTPSDEDKYSRAEDEGSLIGSRNDTLGHGHGHHGVGTEVIMTSVLSQEEQPHSNSNSSSSNNNSNIGSNNNNSNNTSTNNRVRPWSSASGGDVIIQMDDQRGDAPTTTTATTATSSNGGEATAMGATTASNDPDSTNPNGILLTAEEEMMSKYLEDSGNGYHQALDHDPVLATRTRLIQRILLGLGGFCFATSWVWSITIWILKFTMDPHCWNPFDDSEFTDYNQFQETWNFCYLTFWPMSFVTFSPEFPLVTGSIGLAAGMMNYRLICLLLGPFVLFAVAVMLVLIILAFHYGFPAIFPLLLAAYAAIILVIGILMLVIVKPMGLINEAEERKRALRKKLGLDNNANN